MEELKALRGLIDLDAWCPAANYYIKALDAAIAAWEKERAERSGDAEGFAEKVDELSALRAEVLKVAEEMERTADENHLDDDLPLYDACVNGAARLRKACE